MHLSWPLQPGTDHCFRITKITRRKMHRRDDRLTGQRSVLGVSITYQWHLGLKSRCFPSLGLALFNSFINDLMRCHGNHDFLYLQQMRSHTGTSRALEAMVAIHIGLGKKRSHCLVQQWVWCNCEEIKVRTRAGHTPENQGTCECIQQTVSPSS